jgi:hypothetical protein
VVPRRARRDQKDALVASRRDAPKRGGP